MGKIGSYVSVGADGAAGAAGPLDSSTAFFVIQSQWGIDNFPTVVTSPTDFAQKFGGPGDYLISIGPDASGSAGDVYGVDASGSTVQPYYAVEGYFTNKGATGAAVIVRQLASGVAYTLASLSLSGSVTSANATTITALQKGESEGVIQVSVTASLISTGKRFTIYHPRKNITEVFDIVTAQDAASANSKSQLVSITLPASGEMPVSTTTARKLGNFVAGTRDQHNAIPADMIGTISAAGVKTGLQAFTDRRWGPGMIAIPGFFDVATQAALLAHADPAAGYGRLAHLGTTSGLTFSTVQTAFPGGNSAYATRLWPNVRVSDSFSRTAGASLLIDPVGHMMGLQARMDATFGGPHKSAAGTKYALLGVLDVEKASNGMELVDDNGSNQLNDLFINTLRQKGGVVGWGFVTSAADSRFRQVPVVRTLLAVVYASFSLSQPYVGDPDDSFEWAQVRGDFGSYLSTLLAVRALSGNKPTGPQQQPGDAYTVICDSSNNLAADITAGQLNVRVVVSPTPNIQNINVSVVNSQNGLSSVSIT